MKGKKLLILLAVAAILCGCRNWTENETSAAQTDITEISAEQTQMTLDLTQGTTVDTEPQHSHMYISEYTSQQIFEYFAEVALDMEYSFGDGDVSLIQKWTAPIFYRIYGEPTEEDCATLDALAAQLNSIPGFPGIYVAEAGVTENFSISFLPQDGFDERFREVVNGEYAFGAVQFWYYTETNEIHTAQVGCRADIDQTVRNSVLQEELINAMGISDTVLREDSVVYQYSDENLSLSEVDLLILKLLYSPDIRCGMGYEDCLAVVEKLYY